MQNLIVGQKSRVTGHQALSVNFQMPNELTSTSKEEPMYEHNTTELKILETILSAKEQGAHRLLALSIGRRRFSKRPEQEERTWRILISPHSRGVDHRAEDSRAGVIPELEPAIK